MQMTPDDYADYIADGGKCTKHAVRWQFLRDRAKGVLDLFRPKKVTKEELETALAAAVREEYGYDIVPYPTRKRCLLDAMKSLGLEVENNSKGEDNPSTETQQFYAGYVLVPDWIHIDHSDPPLRLTKEQIEKAARGIAECKNGSFPDDWWQRQMESYYDMCADFPGYAKGHAMIPCAMREARAAFEAVGLELED